MLQNGTGHKTEICAIVCDRRLIRLLRRQRQNCLRHSDNSPVAARNEAPFDGSRRWPNRQKSLKIKGNSTLARAHLEMRSPRSTTIVPAPATAKHCFVPWAAYRALVVH